MITPELYKRWGQIVFLLWDNETDYNDDSTQKKIGGLFKNKHRIYSKSNFTDVLHNNNYGPDQEYIFFVHLAHNNDNEGYRTFIESKILMDYPKLKFYCISRTDRSEIYSSSKRLNVYSWEGYREEIDRTFIPQTVLQMQNHQENSTEYKNDDLQNLPIIKYAIITALYKDEFEELKKVFDFPKKNQIKKGTKIFYKGYLKSNRNIEVIAAVQNATGMLDASIIATLLIEYFKPQYILMSGVCGGAKNTSFGDIIIAKQVFTFQKGKISDLQKQNENGEFEKIDLYDRNNDFVDYSKLFDQDGNKVKISIEKFTIEHDSIIPLDPLVEDSINPELRDIEDNINKSIRENIFFKDKRVNIKIEPIACSTMVINKEGYFEDTIKSVHRKTAAVEMESYGVVRACMYANNGKTIPIIFKSVMDKTEKKVDVDETGFNYKKFAAYTSAQFMKELLERDIL